MLSLCLKLTSDYRFIESIKDANKNGRPFVFVEGFLVFHPRVIPLLDIKFLIYIPSSVCYKRRMGTSHVAEDYYHELLWPSFLYNHREILTRDDVIILDGETPLDELYPLTIDAIETLFPLESSEKKQKIKQLQSLEVKEKFNSLFLTARSMHVVVLGVDSEIGFQISIRLIRRGKFVIGVCSQNRNRFVVQNSFKNFHAFHQVKLYSIDEFKSFNIEPNIFVEGFICVEDPVLFGISNISQWFPFIDMLSLTDKYIQNWMFFAKNEGLRIYRSMN